MRGTPLLAVVLLGTACGPPAEAFCDLEQTLPPESDVPVGAAEWSQDGAAVEEEATYSVGPGASFVAGTLTIDLVADETGTSIEELVERGAFPVCVRIGARAEDTMSANLVDEGLVSDASHTGALSILAAEGDTLVGRFELELGDHALTDGKFRATKR